ncbi:MAG: saccharopine dehydrogenase NADP-binding domain-containing protein [Proteobacteria bacterium]|nr:saccharopine dehydrogenase NADP-binding domain-containing protein [Pseudomonadota bacterium]
MKNILLLGAGKIGETIAALLGATGDYQVTVADNRDKNLKKVKVSGNVETLRLDFSNCDALVGAMKGKFAVISAAPFFMNADIARAAAQARVHFLDLTEDVGSTQVVKQLARKADTAFIPQCGLAPGFISIVAYHLAGNFDTLQNVHLRVGALPQFPSNALKYNLTWSTDGLINEYLKPCEAIVRGELREVLALEELEHFSLDGIEYEAFNTSGGLGTLAETLKGKVQNLNYRSIRYPGHRDIIKMLVQDLRLGERPEILKEIFEHALPKTHQDVVLIYVTVTGYKDGEYLQETYTQKVYARKIDGEIRSGIQITTASAVCAVLDLLVEGKIPGKGFIRQEEIKFKDFIENRFGKNFATNNRNGNGLG